MKKIRTLEELDTHLTKDITWRKQEIQTVKQLVQKNRDKNDRVMINYLLRSGIALLYAHWEGFIKHCATAYIYYVALKRLPYSQMATNFIALSMREKIVEAGKAKKPSIHNQFTQFFIDGMPGNCDITSIDVVDAQGNLNSSVFREIIHMLGITYRPEYETKEKLIDENLLRNRNSVAHGDGEFLSLDADGFIELSEIIKTLLESFHTDIVNAATLESYIRK